MSDEARKEFADHDGDFKSAQDLRDETSQILDLIRNESAQLSNTRHKFTGDIERVMRLVDVLERATGAEGYLGALATEASEAHARMQELAQRASDELRDITGSREELTRVRAALRDVLQLTENTLGHLREIDALKRALAGEEK